MTTAPESPAVVSDFNLIPAAYDRGKAYGEAHDDVPHWRAVLVQLRIHHRSRLVANALASFDAGRVAAGVTTAAESGPGITAEG